VHVEVHQRSWQQTQEPSGHLDIHRTSIRTMLTVSGA